MSERAVFCGWWSGSGVGVMFGGVGARGGRSHCDGDGFGYSGEMGWEEIENLSFFLKLTQALTVKR